MGEYNTNSVDSAGPVKWIFAGFKVDQEGYAAISYCPRTRVEYQHSSLLNSLRVIGSKRESSNALRIRIGYFKWAVYAVSE